MMEEDAIYLQSQTIEWSNPKQVDLKAESFDSGMRIASNAKFLGIRIPMRLHGLVRPAALERAIQRRQDLGKPIGGLRWWLSEKVGESPAKLDVALVQRTALNIKFISKQLGFLDADCSAVIDSTKERTVEVRYLLEPGPLWKLGSIDWSDNQMGMDGAVSQIEIDMKPGDDFAVDDLEATRNQVARDLRNRGFASVQASHVNFIADTSQARHLHEVKLEIELAPEGWFNEETPKPHQEARFGRVTWSVEGAENDSLIRSNVVEFLMSIEEGMRYNDRVLQETQRRVVELPCVSRVDIPGSFNGLVNEQLIYDVNVLLHPAKRFGMTTSLDMTRTDARYGPVLSWSLMDRLASGRGDEWDIQLSGGITSTRPFSYSNDYLVPNSGAWMVQAHYSTLGIPPIPLLKLRPSNRARSDFAFNWGRENRPEYAQNSLIFKWGFHFIENPASRSEFRMDLMEFRRLKISTEEGFRQWLEDQSNPYLTARFQDYASILSRVDWRTDWSVSSRVGGSFRIQAEWTGWGLEALANNRNWASNESGQLLLGNIPFAHYFRTEGEWIWERKENQQKGTSWHGRLRGGWAVNGANFNGIPFDRSFFAGGANGLRGWSARDLGPGFANPDDFNGGFVSGLGDLQGELSVETRKDLTEVFEMAFFTDLGNVWLQNSSADVASEKLTFDLRSLAWGAGVGARLDFEFFIFRVDAALRLHDPVQMHGKRWISEGPSKGTLHLGIGYPF